MTKKDLLNVAFSAVLAAAGTGLGAGLAFGADSHAVNASPSPVSAAPPSFAGIVDRVGPAVLSVEVEQNARPAPAAVEGQVPFLPFGPEDSPFGDLRRFFGPEAQGQHQATPLRAAGSGFFISSDGYIVTNNHVVEDARKVTVKTQDGRELPARIIGRDPATDLAVLKVDGHNFPFVTFEDRARPRVGDWVVAVGNPFNLGGTATAGIVSALRRPNVSGSGYVDFMQIDAPINRGNSGGPTFDLYGRVVGVNTAIFSPSGGSVGIGFDIPADVAAKVAQQLIANGKVTRGYIGATVQDVTPEIGASLGLPAHQGALVADVENGGPSSQAGLQSGDIVEAVDGHPIHSAADLTRAIGLIHPGEAARLEVRRAARTQTLEIRTALRPSERELASLDQGGGGPAGPAGGLGLLVRPKAGGGLEIEQVSPASDAAQQGLQAGDVIRKIGPKVVNSGADVRAGLDEARAAHRKEILLLIQRGGRDLFVPLQTPGARG